MAQVLSAAALIVSALLLILVVPHALARWRSPRTDPARALLLWQAVSVSGVLCALLAAPVVALTLGLERPLLLGLAALVSGVMLARVLWSAHRVGTYWRRLRAARRDMVDVLGERWEGWVDGAQPGPVRVLADPSPMAYCLPGKGDRIVLSRATLELLGPEELRAVLLHERAHLNHRHDLLLELFTVLHEAVPAPVRAHAALDEVHLLAEALADRRAAVGASAPALARALVAMVAPQALGERVTAEELVLREDQDLVLQPRLQHALGAADTQVATRVRLLAQPRATPGLRATLAVGSVAVLALPVVLVLMLWWV